MTTTVTITGGSGSDVLVGTGAAELIVGSNRRESLVGGAGDDVIRPGGDGDFISGGAFFDLVATSGGFAGGANAALRFRGDTGAFVGVFANASTGNLTDPRDVVLDGPFGDPATTVLINAGNAPPAPGNDRTLRFDQDGRFLGDLVDFAATAAGFVNAGGGVFGPNGNYFLGSRSQATVVEVDDDSDAFLGRFFTPGTAVAFPRGFVFGPDGDLFIGNGANPTTGGGGGTILRVDAETRAISTLVGPAQDTELSPLDVILTPDGTRLVVSSEFPFGAGPAARGTVRVYDVATGALVQVLDPGLDAAGQPLLAVPRGLGFGPDGLLYSSSTGTGTVLRFDLATGQFLGVFADSSALGGAGINGQAINFLNPAARPDDGTDTVDYSGLSVAVSLDLGANRATFAGAGGPATDTLFSIENAIGTGFHDRLVGDGGANVLAGGAGNDTLIGGGGVDTAVIAASSRTVVISRLTEAQIAAIPGAQAGIPVFTIQNGLEIDTVQTEIIRFEDTTFTVSGTFLEVGGGDRAIAGTDAADRFEDGGGDSVYTLGGGNDVVLDGFGDDLYIGGAGDDYLESFRGNDFLRGGAGNDILVVSSVEGAGQVILQGETGADRYVIAPAVSETVNVLIRGFQIGQDLIDFSALSTRTGAPLTALDVIASVAPGQGGTVRIDLSNFLSLNGQALSGSVTLTGVNPLAFTQAVAAGTAVNFDLARLDAAVSAIVDPLDLFGASFNNQIAGGTGNDTLTGTPGSDTIVGGAGTDTVTVMGSLADAGIGLLTAAQVAALPLLQPGVPAIAVTVGGQTDVVQAETITFAGGGTLTTTGAFLTVSGAATVTGGNGVDLIRDGAGDTVLLVGGGNDVVLDGAGNDTLVGGAGNDLLESFSGSNTLFGEGGNDILFVANTTGGLVELNGGDGADRFVIAPTAGAPIDINIRGFGVGSDILDLSSLSTLDGAPVTAEAVFAALGFAPTVLGAPEIVIDLSQFLGLNGQRLGGFINIFDVEGDLLGGMPAGIGVNFNLANLNTAVSQIVDPFLLL